MLEEISGVAGSAGLGAAAVGVAHSPLAVRMWETLEKTGIGILKPLQMRRMAKADGERRISAAQTDRMVAQISTAPSSYLTGLAHGGSHGSIRVEPTLAQGSPLLPNLVERTVRNAEVRLLREELNFSGAILHAEDALMDDVTAAPAEAPDEDWFYAWRDSAARSSEETMQMLWGRILAGEVKSPGKFSLRTLDFLRLMSASDAKLIAAVAPFMLDNLFFMKGAAVAAEAGVGDGALLTLGEMGVLSHPPFGQQPPKRRWLPMEPGDEVRIALRAGKLGLGASSQIPNQEVMTPAMPFTLLGRSIVSLVECEPNERYLDAIGADFERQNCLVEIGTWETLPDGLIRINNGRPVPKEDGA